MSLVFADRVHETSISTGAAAFTLAGAEPNSNTFVAAIGNGNTTHYAIVSQVHNEWEVGLGTLSGGNLVRTTVYSSSNGNAAVNFTAGVKDVYGTVAATFFALGGIVQNFGNTPSIQAGLSTTAVGPAGTLLLATDTRAVLRSDGTSWVAMSPIPQLTGDISNVGVGATVMTLANTAVTPGSYANPTLSIDSKGRITSAANGNAPLLSLSGDLTTSGSGAGTATLATVNGTVGQFSVHTVNAKGLTTAAANLSLTGDLTGTASGASLSAVLQNVNANSGQFTALTVNSKGLVTGATNVSLSGDVTGTASGGTISTTVHLSLSGAITGSAAGGNIVTSLAPSGVTAGSYVSANVTVNAAGQITAITNGSGGGGGITQLTGDVTTPLGSGVQAATLATVNSNTGTFQGLTLNAKGLVIAAADQNYVKTISLSGDVTGTAVVTTNSAAITGTLANSGVSAGSGNWVTVNAKGLTTALVTKSAALNMGMIGPAAGTYVAMLSAPRPGTITSLTAQTDVGSCTVAIQIGTTNVTGLSAVAVSSTAATTAASAANTFIATNKIQVVVSGVTGTPGQLNLTITFTPS